jgi:hypothetical protein
MLTKILNWLGLNKPVKSNNIGLNFDGTIPSIKSELDKLEAKDEKLNEANRNEREAARRKDLENDFILGEVKECMTTREKRLAEIKKKFEDAAKEKEEERNSGTYRYVPPKDPRKRLRSKYKTDGSRNIKPVSKPDAKCRSEARRTARTNNDDSYYDDTATRSASSYTSHSSHDYSSSCDSDSSSSSCGSSGSCD